MMHFTTADYIAAIDRELAKRCTTYPKILQKMDKRGMPDAEISQKRVEMDGDNMMLNLALRAIQYNNLMPELHESVLAELSREYKMRRKCYLRFIYFKRMTQETADYELIVWRELCCYFAETFMGGAHVALDAIQPKTRRRHADPR